MALSIKSAEVDRLARQLAAETGESLTEALLIALRERLGRQVARRGPSLGARLSRIQSDAAALPVRDSRTPRPDHRLRPRWSARVTQPASHGLIVDTSAGVAIVLDEPGSAALIAFLEASTTRLMSAASRVELGIVVESRLGPLGGDVALRFVRDAEIETVDVDADSADRALGAWRRYGKGRHRAGLDYGDCFVYALAERTGFPVLCVGDDFAATDLHVLRAVNPTRRRPEDGSDR